MALPVTARTNEKGHLEIGGCDAAALARDFGTPLYVMDKKTIIGKLTEYVSALKKNYPDSLMLYASKALSTVGMLKLVAEAGAGADVVSGGEMITALKAGIDPKKIYFHGNNKSAEEIQGALDAGVGRIVVDSIDELMVIDDLTKQTGIKANILIRINPGIEAHTHDFIKTGQTDSKFGISKDKVLEAVLMAKKMRTVNFMGLHAHIGSQILKVNGYLAEVDVLLAFSKKIKNELNIDIKELNIGGGFGIAYTSDQKDADIAKFMKAISLRIKSVSKKLGLSLPKLLIEPGRSIVGQAGVTLYTAGTIKEVPKIRKYVAVDGGMGDNIRPSLYSANYSAVAANRMKEKKGEKITLCGRYCESGDVLIRDVTLPKLSRGDIVAVLCTGAYNYSMASNYNRVPRPAMVLVENGKAQVIVKRETIEDLTSNDVI